MSKKYDFQKIEKYWQAIWRKEETYEPDIKNPRKKFYNLMMFPYPSAEGLHVGNMYAFTGSDVYGRFKRMQGYDVFEPMGLDGFGIHSENYAMKIGAHPMKQAKVSEKRFYKQLEMIGNGFAWNERLETYDPDYYKWTQWIFIQMFKRGLAYRKKQPVNWCPSCKTVLADEQVIAGKCERCGSVVIKKDLEQWFFRITNYAERLLKNLGRDIDPVRGRPRQQASATSTLGRSAFNGIDWSEKVKIAQRNWIGKSEGLIEQWNVERMDIKLETFTTWPHTTYGATFIVISPEHPVVEKLVKGTRYEARARKFIQEDRKDKTKDATSHEKTKKGFFTGRYVINFLTKEKIPVYIANFVLMEYGTGVVKGAPAHDQRDFEFATKYKLPIKIVVCPHYPKKTCPILKEAYVGPGHMVGAGKFDGMPDHEAREAIAKYSIELGHAKRAVVYRLRDWLISRQRYWGPPIPMIFCEQCAAKPKILLLHGLGGNSRENWFPWFKREAELRGYEVLIPNLPRADKPVLSEWLSALKKLELGKNEKLSVIGHSLGAPAACQFVRENKLKIKKLILIAPTGAAQGEKNWKNLRKAGLDPAGVATIKDFNSANAGLKEVARLVRKAILYLSDNDPYIPLGVKENYAPLNPKTKIFTRMGHFNDAGGVKELPALLDEFPIVDSSNVGWRPVLEKDLPVKLPFVKDFRPKGTGQSPLATVQSFYETECPKCGSKARRETDVSDTFLDSAWYYIAYLAKISNLKSQISNPFSNPLIKKWLPVDAYIGGAEHSVLHLLYSRFLAMALHDFGLLHFDEPFTKFRAHGLLIKEGAKMSKSKGNVVNPDEYIKKFGADTLRMYLMFIAPFEQGGDFRDSSILGVSRFLERVWRLYSDKRQATSDKDELEKLERFTHQTIKKVTEDIENLRYNTAISALMILLNKIEEINPPLSHVACRIFPKLLAPFASYITEEIWRNVLGNKKSIHIEPWPEYDPKLISEATFTLVIQVNGKLRDSMEAPAGIGKGDAETLALGKEKIRQILGTKKPKKVIYVPNRLINIVV